jgi:hypothetical protein
VIVIALYFWRLEVPIGEAAAEWLVWLNLALLPLIFYFGARFDFERKWTAPNRSNERQLP